MELLSLSPSGRRSSSEMFPLVELWQTLDQSQLDFCAEHNIKPHVFSYWKRKYKQKEDRNNVNGFAPIAIKDAPSHGYDLEIEYRNGTYLRIRRLVSAELIKELLPDNTH